MNDGSPPLPAFFGLTENDSPYRSSRIAVLPLPWDGTSTWHKGADAGPRALLEASTQLEEYDFELECFPLELGITTLQAPPLRGRSPAAAVAAVREAARRPLADGKFLLGIGGEHSVSIGLFQAHQERHGEYSILQIDAHTDLRDEYEGSPYNHACVMRRAAEIQPRAPIVSVAVRAVSQPEHRFARERGIHLFPGPRIARGEDWIAEVVACLRSPVYVTFDLDGLDPSVLPSTGTPMPGGLHWYPALELLGAVAKAHRVIGADITELKPDPVNHHSQFLAAQLAYKMMAFFVDR